jgi:hypothetical protein
MDGQVGRVEQMETANASSKRSLDAKAAGTKSSTVCGRELCQVSTQSTHATGTFADEECAGAPESAASAH